jgi:UDP-glucose 4-epimerase
MARFLLSVDQAVDTLFEGIKHCASGEIFVPRIRSARVIDIARVLRQDLDLAIAITGVRPGEKIHEILVSEEEAFRTVKGVQNTRTYCTALNRRRKELCNRAGEA